jgi:Fe-S-cluster containining protein
LRIPSGDREVLALYAEADRLLAGWTCESSTDCCRFAVTGREPQLWPNEWRVLERAIAARGVPIRKLRVVGGPARLGRASPVAKAKRSPLKDAEETCPLLDRGRCTVYVARPFGCRTFFCDRAVGPERRLPRAELAEIGRRIATAARVEDPRCDGPRRITAWLRR